MKKSFKKQQIKKTPPIRASRVRLTNVREARRFLAGLIRKTSTSKDQFDLERLKAISYGCQTLLTYFEAEILTDKLEAIEQRLNGQAEGLL